jgi:hypothetical protein
MLPSRDYSLPSKPSFSFHRAPEHEEEREDVPLSTSTPVSVAPIRVPSKNAWNEHVKNVHSSLKAVDPSTTFKEAMTHAKASYKRK